MTNTDISILASKEVKIPNGKNCNDKMENKLRRKANMIRITHEITGINGSNHYWSCSNLTDHDESIKC